ncbi:MAG: serine hydrolase domain-containing protein [Bacteroidota bacterium]
MKRRLLLLTIFLSFSASTIFSQNLATKTDQLYQVKENEPGFSIAVYKKDRILFEQQYGLAHLDYNVPVNENTVFDIGSIGKQFTAAAILLLEAEGKLSIKNPAYKYIDNLPRYAAGDPSIEQLLNQTSGIKEVDPYLGVLDLGFRDYLSQPQMVNMITKIEELHFAPGSYFYYTNANYILLASIIEQVSGKSYGEYLQEAIFGPLQMESTLVNTSTYRTIKDRAIGYTEDEGTFYKTHQYALFYLGDGQILTTPRDMFKWHQGLVQAKIGTPALWKKMHTKAQLKDGTLIDFGLGVEFETHNGHEAYGFDGMIISGFVSKYLYFPALDLAFFSTQNNFAWDFRDRYFDWINLYVPKTNSQDEESEYKPVALSKEEMEKYEGTYLYYYNDDDRKANKVQRIKKKLWVTTLDGDKIEPLIPLGNHQFLFGEDADALVTFNFDESEKYYTYDDFENEKPWLFKPFQPYTYTAAELKEYEGQYYNEQFQIGKQFQLEDGKLYYYYRHGALKEEVESLGKDLLEIPMSPIEFKRDQQGEIVGFDLMGLFFKKF